MTTSLQNYSLFAEKTVHLFSLKRKSFSFYIQLNPYAGILSSIPTKTLQMLITVNCIINIKPVDKIKERCLSIRLLFFTFTRLLIGVHKVVWAPKNGQKKQKTANKHTNENCNRL